MYIPPMPAREMAAIITNMPRLEGDVVGIMFGEKGLPDIDQLITVLNTQHIVFFGAIFPGIIHGNHIYEEGANITILPAVDKPFLIRGLDTEDIAMPDFGEAVMASPDKPYTALTLVDGRTLNIAAFLQEIYNRLGPAVHYLGGGAGVHDRAQHPSCLFTAEGFVRDAAIVTFLKLESRLGVRHGWEKIEGPLVVTKAQRNIIKELNWKTAFEVYREIVEQDSQQVLTRDNFISIARGMGYCFGIVKEGTEDVVRDPILVDEQGWITCVAEVPENALLSVLKGSHTSLLQAADQAADDCIQDPHVSIRQTFIVDCLSRTYLLGTNFPKELAVVHHKLSAIQPSHIPMGILTLGEIASYGETFLDYLNKTIVVGLFYE